jgi:hypothetical protein
MDQGETADSRRFAIQLGDEDQDENGGGHRRTLIRVTDRAGSEHLVYALVAEDIDFCMLGLSYGAALRILLNKKSGEMICTTDAQGALDAQRESQQSHRRLALEGDLREREGVDLPFEPARDPVGQDASRWPWILPDRLTKDF